MPKYVKNGREIFASTKAFKLFYEDQGYLPVNDKTSIQADPLGAADDEPVNPETSNEDIVQGAPVGAQADPLGAADDEPVDPEDLPDDFGEEDDAEEEKSEIDLSVNGNTPLAARVALLPYDKLKKKAKELGIPKYSQTKFDELVTLVTEAIEKSNAN